LTLSQSPRAAADARRWVAHICRELGRDDLVETAELGTSELVTNALLHGLAPISVSVRGTASHPRIEVRDGSCEPPAPPRPTADLDDELATFGRGLSLVAMSSVAWGASIEEEGKVVWFEPAPVIGDTDPSEAVIDNYSEPGPAMLSDQAVPVELLGIDVELATGLWRQYDDLRRELRLLAVSHQEQYPLAANLSALFTTYEKQLPPQVSTAVREAADAGRPTVDLTVKVEPEAAPIMTTMLEMFDLADAFCRAERLLSLQRTALQRAFHVWYRTELVRQVDGAEATRFVRPEPSEVARTETPAKTQQVS